MSGWRALALGTIAMAAAACNQLPDMKVFVSGLPANARGIEYVVRYLPNTPVNDMTTLSNDAAPTRILFADHPNTDVAADYTFTARVSFPDKYTPAGQLAIDVAALDSHACPIATGTATTLVPLAFDQILLPVKTSMYRGTTASEPGDCKLGKPQILYVSREKSKQNTAKPSYKFSILGWPFFQTTKVTVSATAFPQLKFTSFTTRATDNLELLFDSVTTSMFGETAFDNIFFADNVPVTVTVENPNIGMSTGSVSAASLFAGSQ